MVDHSKTARAIYEAHRGKDQISARHASAEVRAKADQFWATLPQRKPEEYQCVMAEARAAFDAIIEQIEVPSEEMLAAGINANINPPQQADGSVMVRDQVLNDWRAMISRLREESR